MIRPIFFIPNPRFDFEQKEIELIRSTFLICLALMTIGCSKQNPDERAVYPVTGVITVDGAPVEGLQIKLHEESVADPSKPIFPSGFSRAEGKVSLSTYAEGDGVPSGAYKVTIKWQEFNPLSMSFSGPDKLNGRYSDADKTELRWTITESKMNDLGTIALTTK